MKLPFTSPVKPYNRFSISLLQIICSLKMSEWIKTQTVSEDKLYQVQAVFGSSQLDQALSFSL